MDDKMQRELMSKLAELESKHKRRLPRMIYIFASAKVWIELRRILRLFQKSFSVQRSTCSKNKNPSMTNSVERYRKSATVISHTGQRTNIGKLF